MQEATINVRLPLDLKLRGDAVLRRTGVSASSLVREAYRYMAEAQELPAYASQESIGQEQLNIRRREALNKIAGILPESVDSDAMRWARLQRQLPEGDRDAGLL
jgi:DNA-damage-inducible protein J